MERPGRGVQSTLRDYTMVPDSVRSVLIGVSLLERLITVYSGSHSLAVGRSGALRLRLVKYRSSVPVRHGVTGPAVSRNWRSGWGRRLVTESPPAVMESTDRGGA